MGEAGIDRLERLAEMRDGCEPALERRDDVPFLCGDVLRVGLGEARRDVDAREVAPGERLEHARDGADPDHVHRDRCGRVSSRLHVREQAHFSPRRALAVLVHNHGRKARIWNVVATAVGGSVRAYTGAGFAWRYQSGRMAYGAAEGMSYAAGIEKNY